MFFFFDQDLGFIIDADVASLTLFVTAFPATALDSLCYGAENWYLWFDGVVAQVNTSSVVISDRAFGQDFAVDWTRFF